MAGLLDLPLELRIQIYRELSAKCQIPLIRPTLAPRSGERLQCSVLSVNRQIYDESKQVLYGESSWIVTVGLDTVPTIFPTYLNHTSYIRKILFVIVPHGCHRLDYGLRRLPLRGVHDSCSLVRSLPNVRMVMVSINNGYSFPIYCSAIIGAMNSSSRSLQEAWRNLYWLNVKIFDYDMSKILEPLAQLPQKIALRKGTIDLGGQTKQIEMSVATDLMALTRAFDNCMTAVIELRKNLE